MGWFAVAAATVAVVVWVCIDDSLSRPALEDPAGCAGGNADLYRLSLELADVQMVVEAVAVEQLLMRSALDDLPLPDHQHLVGVADRAQAVGDDEAGPPLHQPQQRLLDSGLGAGVHAAGGLVQDQDARIGQDRPRSEERRVGKEGR